MHSERPIPVRIQEALIQSVTKPRKYAVDLRQLHIHEKSPTFLLPERCRKNDGH